MLATIMVVGIVTTFLSIKIIEYKNEQKIIYKLDNVYKERIEKNIGKNILFS